MTDILALVEILFLYHYNNLYRKYSYFYNIFKTYSFIWNNKKKSKMTIKDRANRLN